MKILRNIQSQEKKYIKEWQEKQREQGFNYTSKEEVYLTKTTTTQQYLSDILSLGQIHHLDNIARHQKRINVAVQKLYNEKQDLVFFNEIVTHALATLNINSDILNHLVLQVDKLYGKQRLQNLLNDEAKEGLKKHTSNLTRSLNKNIDDISKHYDSPEFWVTAFGIDQSFYNEKQLKQLMNIIQSSVNSPEVKKAVEQKDYDCYMNKIMEQIYNFSGFKIQSQRDIHGNTPLHIASNSTIDNLLTRAQEQDLDLNTLKNNYQQTPIHVAACSFNFGAIEKLLEHSSSLKDVKDKPGKTFYNNIMDNINSSSYKEFESFVTFSSGRLLKENYDIKQYQYDNNNSSLADQLLKAGQYDKCSVLMQAMPEFPVNIENISACLQQNLTPGALDKLNKILESNTTLIKDTTSYKEIQIKITVMLLNAQVQQHSVAPTAAVLPNPTLNRSLPNVGGHNPRI